MHKFFLLLFCVCLLLHCSNTSGDPITEEVMRLTNDIDKRIFLEDVYKDFKGTSKNLPPDIEAINVKKIGAYLELFGHPKQSQVGQTAVQTPWVIIHDNKAEDRLESRTKYFPIFFKAYLNGDINDGQMTMYLNRSYEYKFGEKYKDKGSSSAKNEINSLIALLNLETSLH